TVNTVDVSRATNEYYSAPFYSNNALIIKSSGSGTPGKLNVTAAQSKDRSIAIYSHGDLTLESGDISGIAGKSIDSSSIGIQAFLGSIYIKGGTITATGGTCESIADTKAIFSGSFGLKADEIQIDGGTVTATGGSAKDSLSSGIFGTQGLRLNGGSITAKGDTAAVASFETLTIEGATVNGAAANITEVKDVDPNKKVLHTFVDNNAATMKEVSIQPLN
ncbi:MAG: hypothetical protein RSD28_00965, partial [Lachnospiraceae bacterium]